MKNIKRLFAILLSTCLITALCACDAPAVGGGSGSSKTSASSEPTEVKVPFNNKVEVSFVKIGSDTLGITVMGSLCKNLVKKGTFEDSGKEFAIVIGEEKTITVPREQFADYGIEEEDEEVVSYDIDVYEPYTQIYLYSLDSNLMVLKSGDDWESYRCEFNDANTGAGSVAYFTKITAPGLCDKVNLTGTYRAFAFDKNKEDLTEEYMIAEGDAAKVTKTMSALEFEETYERPVFESWAVKKTAEARWEGEWVSDGSFGVTDATAKVTVSYTGVITWKITINGETKYWFGEENTYVFTEREFSDLVEAGTELYNFRNGSTSCFITYTRSDSKSETQTAFEKIEFKYDSYGDDRVSNHVTFVRKAE